MQGGCDLRNATAMRTLNAHARSSLSQAPTGDSNLQDLSLLDPILGSGGDPASKMARNNNIIMLVGRAMLVDQASGARPRLRQSEVQPGKPELNIGEGRGYIYASMTLFWIKINCHLQLL